MADWRMAVAQLEGRLRSYVEQVVLGVVDFAPGARASSDGTTDAVAGLPAAEPYQTDVRRVQHAGFRSRFAKVIGAVIVKKGGRYFQVAEDDGLDVPLSDGDAVHYAPGNKNAAVATLADGSVAIGSDTGHGKNISVNGGTLEVARQTDPVTVTGGSYTPTSLVLAVKDSAGSVGTITVTVAGGVLVVTPTGVLPTSTFTMQGQVSGGAVNFKA